MTLEGFETAAKVITLSTRSFTPVSLRILASFRRNCLSCIASSEECVFPPVNISDAGKEKKKETVLAKK